MGNVEKNTKEWTKKGDIIGIRGRLQEEEGTLYVMAEKITFLSSKKEKMKGDENGRIPKENDRDVI